MAASEQGRLTIFLSGQNTPDLFVSTGDEGAFTAGYTTRDGSVRYSGFQPGVGDYAGETIHFLGRPSRRQRGHARDLRLDDGSG